MNVSSAREVWRAVLGDLQLQLPRPTFETWLKQTEGVADQDDFFVVEAPSTFAVEWLERRMYHALQKTLEKVTGRAVELRLRVKSGRRLFRGAGGTPPTEPARSEPNRLSRPTLRSP